MYQGNGQRDYIHRVYKVKITEDVRAWSDGSQLQEKRGGNSCPTAYSLCAPSLGGDCCPTNYACAQNSCYATTAAVSTCASATGYYACAATLGAGCCPQGSVCAADGNCPPPAGATQTQTCDTGMFLCPPSVEVGCCPSGMGCALTSCYSLSPATTTLTYTVTEDGSAVTFTTTSVTTTTPSNLSTVTGNIVAKVFDSSVPKTAATTSVAASAGGDSSGGLSKGAIGGIVAAAVIILIAVLTASFCILKRLKHTEQVVQTQRETTSGTRTRQMTEKKSEINVRVVPTPSEVDNFDYDPLMQNSSVASPLRPGQRDNSRQHASGDSETGSQPSIWSGRESTTRWPTPSLNSDAGDYNNNTAQERPPRAHQRGRPERVGSNGSSAYTYRNYTNQAHGRHASDASELSGGSVGGGGDERPIELGVDGEFRPELPGSDTETESNGVGGGRGRWRAMRRKGTAVSLSDLVSPMSVRPGTSLGNINESPVSMRLHGHYGPDPGERADRKESSSNLAGFVSFGRPS